MSYTAQYLNEVVQIAKLLHQADIDKMIDMLVNIRDKAGRIFFLGVGGGAANACHAVNDFRKISGIECYAPTDNVSELTARINDDGWETSYRNWLQISRLGERDAVFVFSVGGGNTDLKISTNLVSALQYAKKVRAKVCGVVGRDGGFTARVSDSCVIVPIVNPQTVTPHTESFQAVLWHLLVSHPRLKSTEMKWEMTSATPTILP